MSDELEGMATFVAVAEAKGFPRSGRATRDHWIGGEPGDPPARGAAGCAIVQRTTRSVRLTEAGERLYAAVHPALEEVRVAVAAAKAAFA
jgi:DNA-binding transcriptional LysR family regulator